MTMTTKNNSSGPSNERTGTKPTLTKERLSNNDKAGNHIQSKEEKEDIKNDDDDKNNDNKNNDDDDDMEEEDTDEEEYDDDDDDEDDDVVLTWKDYIVDAWGQHCIAIVVALVATAVAVALQHYNNNYYNAVIQQQQQASSRSRFPAPTTNQLKPPIYTSPTWSTTTTQRRRELLLHYEHEEEEDETLEQKHVHLIDYKRLANITFCPHSKATTTIATTDSSSLLEWMDFTVTPELVPALLLHMVADLAQDDSYENVLNKAIQDDSDHDNNNQHFQLLQQNEEYQCLMQQQRNHPQGHVTAFTQYYKPPPFHSIYKYHELPTIYSTKKPKNKDKIVVKPIPLSYVGFGAKFVNMAHFPILLHWNGRNNAQQLIGEIPPFQALGTATTPGQTFVVTTTDNVLLDRWILTVEDPIHYYNPFTATSTTDKRKNSLHDNSYNDYVPSGAVQVNTDDQNGDLSPRYRLQDLTRQEHLLYQMQLLNQAFGKQYYKITKRQWLATFPRPFPVLPLWPATYVQQRHIVQLDTASVVHYPNRQEIPPNFQNRTWTVQSVAPRVLTMHNFLSPSECKALLQIAHDYERGFSPSTVYAGGRSDENFQRDASTRSSSNTWLPRHAHALIDTVYHRAAAALRISDDDDDSLLQKKLLHIDDDLHAHYHSIAESLQVLRYQEGEEYTPHHDYVYAPLLSRHQPTRFATLLLYLNDDFSGGETYFPRVDNPSDHTGLTVQPVTGKAVLFYSLLPDGNVDDTSLHGSRPVHNGTKYAANLWLWDPMIN